MSEVTLYHNPNCGTSKNVLSILQDEDVDPEVVLYLKTPLDEAQLRELIGILDDDVADLVRKDKFFKDQGLEAGDYTDEDSVVAILLEHPRLMQRPIVRKGGRAFIARPKEKALEVV